ncbi:MAG: hypothetical protein H7Y00_15045 [Fimbriimonadaceae bacterium]|nr:hypothetical protein [Chitinophagales bacterium]
MSDLLNYFGILFFAFKSFSQTAPEIEWQNTIGGLVSDGCKVIIDLPDGGFLAADTLQFFFDVFAELSSKTTVKAHIRES